MEKQKNDSKAYSADSGRRTQSRQKGKAPSQNGKANQRGVKKPYNAKPEQKQLSEQATRRQPPVKREKRPEQSVKIAF